MINSKQRARLRAIASNEQAIFQTGKNGIGENFIKQVSDALKKREIVKITVLETSPETAKECASEIAKKTRSELICTIGSKIVLYKENKKKPVISEEINKLK